jgi:hypothetical protein
MASVRSLRDAFDNDLAQARRLLEVVKLPTYQKALIYELAFLRCFLAWEVFLEGTFYAYMLQKASPNGSHFSCYMSPRDEQHARDIIRGNRRYATWARSSDVIRRAELYFSNGEPYGNGGLTWPHRGGLIWPHPVRSRPKPCGSLRTADGGRRGDGNQSGVVRADSPRP